MPLEHSGKWDQPYLDNELKLYEDQDIELMDDLLVRQIEAHLAGLPRASEEFGLDAQYLAEREAREKQVFDEENYEAFLDAERLDKMSNYEKQQELLFRRKRKQVDLQSDFN